MKTIQQLRALQFKAKSVSKTLTKEVIAVTQGEQYVDVKPSKFYELEVKEGGVLNKDFDTIAKKVGNDLEVLLTNDTTVIFDGYFEVCSTDLSCLVSLPTEGGVYFVIDGNFTTLDDGSQIVHFYGDDAALTLISSNQSGVFTQSFNTTYLDGGFSYPGGTKGFLASSAVSVAVAAGLPGGGVTAPNVVSFSLSGTFSAGKYTGAEIEEAVFAYKKDGSLIAKTNLKSDGSYTFDDFKGYTGIAYIRVDSSDNIVYNDEKVDVDTDLQTDFFTVVSVVAGKNTAEINAQTTIATQIATSSSTKFIIVNDRLATPAGSSLDISALKISQIDALVQKVLGLKGSVFTTKIDTINSDNDDDNSDASKEAGLMAAALAGANANAGDFQVIINAIAKSIIDTKGLSKEASNLLADGAIIIADKYKNNDSVQAAADKTNEKFFALRITLIIAMAETDGTENDFVVKSTNQTIAVTLDADLTGGKKLWGSVDGGVTWIHLLTDTTAQDTTTDDTTAYVDKILTWTGKALIVGDNSIEFATTSADTTADTVIANKEGAVVAENYILDLTAPTTPTVNLTNDTGETADITTNGEFTVTSNADYVKVEYFVTKDNNGELASKTADEYKNYINSRQSNSDDNGVYKVRVVVTDAAGNTSQTTKEFTLDTKAPTIVSITSTTTDGSFKVDGEIELVVTANETMNADSQIIITLETGVTDRTVTLTRDATDATKFIGTYTVQAGDNSADLTVIKIVSSTAPETIPTDAAGNAFAPSTNIALPENQNLNDNKALVIDTTVPVFSSAETVNAAIDANINVVVYDAQVADVSGANDVGITYSLDDASQDKFNIGKATGEVTYKVKQTAVGTDTITITATDVAGNTSNKIIVITLVNKPIIKIDTVTDNDIISATEKTAGVTISGTSIGANGQDITISWDGIDKTVQVGSDGKWSVTYVMNEISSDTASSVMTVNVDDINGKSADEVMKTVVIDTVAPTLNITITDPILKADETTVVTFTFSEKVIGFSNDDITVPNGTLSNVETADDGKTWTAIFTPTEDIKEDINVFEVGDGFTDIADNIGISKNSDNFTIATKVPTITIDTVADDNKINTAEKADGVTISGASTGANGGNLIISWGDIDKTVTVADDGTWSATYATADIPDSSDIIANVVNASGNSATEASKTVTVDTTAPTIIDITSTTINGNLKVGGEIFLVVTVSEAMIANSQIIVVLETGATNRMITLTRNISDATKFIGTYIVQTGDTSDDLKVTKIIASAALGKIPTDIAGNAFASGANIDLPTGKNLNDNKDFVVDAIAPTFTKSSAQVLGKSSNLVIDFSENIQVSTGNIIIYDADDNVIKTIAIGDDRITITKDKLTINLIDDLTAGSYYVKMDAGAVTDLVGNASAGITNNSDWAFETKALSTSITWVGAEDADNTINNTDKTSDTLSGTIIGGDTSTVEKIEFFEKDDTSNVKFTIDKDKVTMTGKGWLVNANDMPNLLDGKTYIAKIFLKEGDTTIIQTSKEVTYDFTGPTLDTIEIDNTALKAGETTQVTFTFSEKITNFSNNDITIPNGTLTDVETDDGGKTWTAIYTPTIGIEAIGNIFVVGNTFTDIAGNTGTGKTSADFVIDFTAPTHTKSESLVLGESYDLVIDFSENIQVSTGNIIIYDADDNVIKTIAIGDDRITITKDKLTINLIDDLTAGSYYVKMDAGAVTDLVGNASAGITNNSDWAFETKALSTSITWVGAEDADNTINNTDKTSDTLSGTIIGGDTSTVEKIEFFEKDDTSNVKFTIDKDKVTMTGKGWLVNANDMPNLLDGKTYIAKIFLKDDSNTFTETSKEVTYDFIAPTIEISQEVNALKSDETAIITFTLSEVSTNFVVGGITVTGGILSNLQLKTGETKIYTAIFTPTAGSSLTSATISVASNKFTDVAGNNNADGADSNNSVSLSIETLAPTITDITSTTSNNSFKVDDTIDLVVTVSEAMNADSQIIVTLETGENDRTVTLTRNDTDATKFTGIYTVQEGDTSDNLAVIKIIASTTSGKIPTDAAGNTFVSSANIDLPADKNLDDNKNLIIDTTALTIEKTEIDVDNNTISITFDGVLSATAPATSAFVIIGKTVTAVSIVSGDDKLVLTLDSIIDTDVLDITYTKPSSNPLQDLAGNTLKYDRVVIGGTGDDTITSTEKDELFDISSGGVDTFDYNAIENGNGVDAIIGFTIGDGGDILDLSDLLTGETSGTLADFIQITDTGDDVVIRINTDGSGGYTDMALLLVGASSGEVTTLASFTDNDQIVIG